MPKQKALLVGINNYSNPKYALSGCINDIDSLGVLLTNKFNFPSGEIVTLTDNGATQQGIISALQSLINNATPGDTLVFAYSGHGCQKPATKPGTQPSDMSDAIVPYEATYSSLISDEQLFNLITSKITSPAIKFTAIYDCCHSGTMIKDIVFDNNGNLVTDIENRCLFLPDMQGINKKAVAIGPYNVFSACGDGETAADVREVPDEHRARGAFSYALHKLINANKTISAQQLDAQIKPLIASVSSHTQNPEFYAVDPTLPVFT